MSAQDPLSEAREVLRIISRIDEEIDGHHAEKVFRAERLATEALARLDALPAPVRIRKATLGPKSDGWFYPEAPVARDDGGDDA